MSTDEQADRQGDSRAGIFRRLGLIELNSYRNSFKSLTKYIQNIEIVISRSYYTCFIYVKYGLKCLTE